MTKYLQISADLVDVYTGSVLETGATIKFSYTDSIGHTFVTIPTGSVTTISSEWEIKSVSFIAEPQTGRTFSSFSIEVVEKFVCFNSHTRVLWKFPGQELNLSLSCNLQPMLQLWQCQIL